LPEVILLGYQVPEEVVTTALQEDVDVIGVSFMSGGQAEATRALTGALAQAGLSSIPVVVGGPIRPFDIPDLEAAGVRTIFRGGETLESIQETFADLAAVSRADSHGDPEVMMQRAGPREVMRCRMRSRIEPSAREREPLGRGWRNRDRHCHHSDDG
jgi:methylmalonyl-CoA mutase C-terminal domain/subunit